VVMCPQQAIFRFQIIPPKNSVKKKEEKIVKQKYNMCTSFNICILSQECEDKIFLIAPEKCPQYSPSSLYSII